MVWYAIPALAALVIKLGLLTQTRNVTAPPGRALHFFLIFLAVQNVAEVGVFFTGSHGIAFTLVGIYMAATVCALCQGVLFGAAVARIPTGSLSRWMAGLALALVAALWLTNWIVLGYEFNGYVLVSIKGPFYWVFTLTVLGCILAMIGFLLVGTRSTEQRTQRECVLTLTGLTPVFAVGAAVVIMRQMGSEISAAVVIPFAVTFFLAVTVYAVRAHQLFDIRVLIPGTRQWRWFWPLAKELTSGQAPLPERMKLIEEALIINALKQSNGVQSRAARALGLPASSLHRKLRNVAQRQG